MASGVGRARARPVQLPLGPSRGWPRASSRAGGSSRSWVYPSWVRSRARLRLSLSSSSSADGLLGQRHGASTAPWLDSMTLAFQYAEALACGESSPRPARWPGGTGGRRGRRRRARSGPPRGSRPAGPPRRSRPGRTPRAGSCVLAGVDGAGEVAGLAVAPAQRDGGDQPVETAAGPRPAPRGADRVVEVRRRPRGRGRAGGERGCAAREARRAPAPRRCRASASSGLPDASASSA